MAAPGALFWETAMKKETVFLALHALLWILLAALAAAAILRLYGEGAARREAGDALAWIFTRDSLSAALLPLVPLFLAALGMAAAGLILGIRAEGARRPARPAAVRMPPVRHSPRRIGVLRAAALVLAAAAIAAGILNGGMRDVLVKAVNLCTECVGLG